VRLLKDKSANGIITTADPPSTNNMNVASTYGFASPRAQHFWICMCGKLVVKKVARKAT